MVASVPCHMLTVSLAVGMANEGLAAAAVVGAPAAAGAAVAAGAVVETGAAAGAAGAVVAAGAAAGLAGAAGALVGLGGGAGVQAATSKTPAVEAPETRKRRRENRIVHASTVCKLGGYSLRRAYDSRWQASLDGRHKVRKNGVG